MGGGFISFPWIFPPAAFSCIVSLPFSLHITDGIIIPDDWGPYRLRQKTSEGHRDADSEESPGSVCVCNWDFLTCKVLTALWNTADEISAELCLFLLMLTNPSFIADFSPIWDVQSDISNKQPPLSVHSKYSTQNSKETQLTFPEF